MGESCSLFNCFEALFPRCLSRIEIRTLSLSRRSPYAPKGDITLLFCSFALPLHAAFFQRPKNMANIHERAKRWRRSAGRSGASTSIYAAAFIFVRSPWIARVAFDGVASIDSEPRSCARVRLNVDLT